MAVKISVIAAIANLETVDMSIQRLAFPVEYQHDAQKVEFDVYEGGTEIALKGNFAKQSNVVNKGDYKTIVVNPMQINEAITDGVANVNRKEIGRTVYGTQVGAGISDAQKAQILDDIEGYGRLKKRAQRLVKKSIYDVLTTGKVTVSEDGVVVDEIDFGLTNIVVNDNATAGQYQWNDTTNSSPIEQLEKASLDLKKYAFDTVVMGFEAHKAFTAHPKVLTTDNTTTGKKANFYKPSPDEVMSKSTDTFIYVGRTAGDYGKVLEVYAELDQYTTGGTDTFYLDKNYVVGFKQGNRENGQVQYGNIPVASGDGASASLSTVTGKEYIDGEIMKDPAGIKRLYRSSPLPTMNQPKAFMSIKATLIA